MDERAVRVAYLMSRFPKVSETFVLYEMRALESHGADVEVFPLLRGPAGPRHPEAVAYERRAHYLPLLSRGLLLDNLRALRRSPRRYVRVLWEALRGTWGSLRFFAGAVAYYPKCVAFAERMRRLEIEHVHAHFANHPAMAAYVIHRLTGIPFSFTAHGSDLHVERRMLGTKVAHAAFVVAISDYNRRVILEEAGHEHRDKVLVIHCGTDPSVFRADERPARAAESAPLRIICVASLEEVKGHRFLVRAVRRLVDRGIDVRCDLAGDGPERAEIERLVARLSLQGRVHLHGALPRPMVQRLLADADVAVLASHPTRNGKREGIPVALMEAMMSGLPVVASALSGIPELVEDGRTGYLVPPGDPETLADRLACLAAAPQLRSRLGAAGRAKVREEFDLHASARLLLARIRDTRARRNTATIDAPEHRSDVGYRNGVRKPSPSSTAEVGFG